MADWEITATTVYCETVADEVTLVLAADGACRCTGRQKYGRTGKETLKKKSRGGKSGCPPAECEVIMRYRQTLLGKEPAR